MIPLQDVDAVLGADFIDKLEVSTRLRVANQSVLRDLVRAAAKLYIGFKTQPRATQISGELRVLERLAEKALRLRQRRTPRPGEYRGVLQQISTTLAGLSERAREGLVEPPIDPITVLEPDAQWAALLALYGATGRTVPKRGGRPTHYAERHLYSMLAGAFEDVTGMSANVERPEFTDLCESVKERCKLHQFNWASMERATRKGKVQEGFLDLDEDGWEKTGF